MDIVSPPAFTEETVIDLDLAFLNGIRSLTLRDGDSMNTYSYPEIVIRTGNPIETIHVNREQILWYSLRERILRTPVKKETK